MKSLTIALCLTAPSFVAATPNFVGIIADDMSPDTGAYGLKDADTPNLDRLATESRHYARAYGLCQRASVQRIALGGHPRLLPDDVRTAPA